jgi:hypothetical protein
VGGDVALATAAVETPSAAAASISPEMMIDLNRCSLERLQGELVCASRIETRVRLGKLLSPR